MEKKSIIIIGAGIGGLASGVYAQMNGYNAHIFEMNKTPGGVCTSWQRHGYVFDGCIHHLAGCCPGTGLYELWEDLGVFPGRKVLFFDDLVSVEEPGGNSLCLYTDTEKLETELKEVAPEDKSAIEGYVKAIQSFKKIDLLEMFAMGKSELLKNLPALTSLMRRMTVSLDDYAGKFKNEFLGRAFPTLQYDFPGVPLAMHLNILAGCETRHYGWPEGGSLAFIRDIEKRFRELGGEITYGSRVDKILVENDKATGIRLEDESVYRSDYVVSNAYGYSTIFGLLDGCYAGKKLSKYYTAPQDPVEMGIHVSLGVKRDLSSEPHAIVLFLDEPASIAGELRDRLNIEIYSFDPAMAPPGKSVLKVLLKTNYSYWDNLYIDSSRYYEAKDSIAESVISLLESRFPGIKDDIEVVDVATPMTTERYTGNGRPFGMQTGQMVSGMLTGRWPCKLKGLDNFYMVSQWSTLPGIPVIAAAARNLINDLES